MWGYACSSAAGAVIGRHMRESLVGDSFELEVRGVERGISISSFCLKIISFITSNRKHLTQEFTQQPTYQLSHTFKFFQAHTNHQNGTRGMYMRQLHWLHYLRGLLLLLRTSSLLHLNNLNLRQKTDLTGCSTKSHLKSELYPFYLLDHLMAFRYR
jgi:hypothetical protein